MEQPPPPFADLASGVTRTGAMPPGSPGLVGLSGGADSTYLLLGLRQLGFAVTAAHLDHAARPESAADAAWVRERCAIWQVPLVCDRRPVAPGPNFEARAREARLQFFQTAAQGAAWVAVGHNLEDQVETVLFRLARGTGPDGATGMPVVRPLRHPDGDHPTVPLVRPMLGLTRAAIRDTLAALGESWLEDPTNMDPSFTRNRLRQSVLPAIATIHPDALRHIATFADILREENDARQEHLAQLAAPLRVVTPSCTLELDRPGFNALSVANRRGVVRHLASELGLTPPHSAGLAQVLAIAETGGAADLSGGWRVEAKGPTIRLRHR